MRRDFLIIIGTALVAVAIGVFVFLSSRDTVPDTSSAVANSQPSATAVPFTEIAHGSKSTVTRRSNYLVTSTDQLGELWKMVDASGQIPTVDFTQNDVIAVFTGTEPTTGYAIAIAQVEDSTVRAVTVMLTKPGGSCLPTQSLTTPYQIVVLAKTALPLVHKDTTTTVDCLQ